MRRLPALLLFTAGYMLMALLAPEVAAFPALVAFAAGGLLLVRQQPQPADPVEQIAHELARR